MTPTMGPEAEETPQVEDQGLAGEEELGGKLRALEAVLFMAAEPLPPDELAEILEVTLEQVEALGARLSADCSGRGIQVTRVAGGYQVSTRPEYGPYVARLHEPERFRLSRAALETLAIVAYRQPVTRPEIEAIRGVNSDSPVDTLLQYELVCEAGRKEAPGRPVLYRTTKSFLGKFGLDSIADLPRLEAIPAEQFAAELPSAGREASPREEASSEGPQEQSRE